MYHRTYTVHRPWRLSQPGEASSDQLSGELFWKFTLCHRNRVSRWVFLEKNSTKRASLGWRQWRSTTTTKWWQQYSRDGVALAASRPRTDATAGRDGNSATNIAAARSSWHLDVCSVSLPSPARLPFTFIRKLRAPAATRTCSSGIFECSRFNGRTISALAFEASHTVRYDTMGYINVRSKGDRKLHVAKRKTKTRKQKNRRIGSNRVCARQSGVYRESMVERICGKIDYKWHVCFIHRICYFLIGW